MNTLNGIAVGEYGRVMTITCVDDVDAAIDISTYTIAVKFRSKKYRKLITLVGTFLTDGTNGKFTCSFTSTNTPLQAGDWTGQVVLTKTNTLVRSEPFTVPVWASV